MGSFKVKTTVLDTALKWYKLEFPGGSFLYCYDGDKVNEIHHNPYGPSYHHVFDGYTEYRVHGKLHRLDGPAVIDSRNGNSFWIEGVKYNNELEYWIAVEKYLKDHPEELLEDYSQD